MAPQGSRTTSPFVTSVVSGRSVMVGLESLEDDDSEVADATVTFAELLNSDLPSEEAEARHLGRDLIGKKSVLVLACRIT